MLGQPRSAWEKLSDMKLIWNGEIPSPRQTSIDKTNDCDMKSERGALVRDSNPPQCSHDGRWYVTGASQALDNKHLTSRVKKTDDKKCRSLSDGKKYTFFRVLVKSVKHRGQPLSPPRQWMHTISSKPPSTFTGLARNEAGWPWVDCIYYVEIEGRSSRELFFFISMLTFFNVKNTHTKKRCRVQPREKTNKRTFFSRYIVFSIGIVLWYETPLEIAHAHFCGQNTKK